MIQRRVCVEAHFKVAPGLFIEELLIPRRGAIPRYLANEFFPQVARIRSLMACVDRSETLLVQLPIAVFPFLAVPPTLMCAVGQFSSEVTLDSGKFSIIPHLRYEWLSSTKGTIYPPQSPVIIGVFVAT